jgi:hypothetical protein
MLMQLNRNIPPSSIRFHEVVRKKKALLNLFCVYRHLVRTAKIFSEQIVVVFRSLNGTKYEGALRQCKCRLK